MKKISTITQLSAIALAIIPVAVSAQDYVVIEDGGGAFGELLRNILLFSNNILIPFILGIGFLVFVWGMFQYFIAGGANDDKKEAGKSLMVYATLGFVLVIIFWGVVNLVAQSTGLDEGTIDPPSAQGINL